MDDEEYIEAIMGAYKHVLLAYQRHVGKDNMMLILHETGVDIIEEDDGRLGGKLKQDKTPSSDASQPALGSA